MMTQKKIFCEECRNDVDYMITEVPSKKQPTIIPVRRLIVMIAVPYYMFQKSMITILRHSMTFIVLPMALSH